MSALEEKQRWRLQFMRHLYELGDSSPVPPGDITDIGKQIGIFPAEALQVSNYLTDEGLIQTAGTGLVALTQQGVREVEAAMQNPDQDTEHFPRSVALDVMGDIVRSRSNLTHISAQAIDWARSNPVPALTVSGLVAYGFLRLDYSLFYSGFGVKPEDVGLGYGEILSQSLVGLLLLAGVFLALSILLSPDTRAGRRALPFSSGATLQQWIAIGSVGLLFLSLFVIPRTNTYLFAFLALLASLVLAETMIIRYELSVSGERHLTAEVWKAVLRVSLPVAVIFALAFFTISALDDAAKVQRGEPVHFSLIGVPILSWGADRASVTWTGGTIPAEFKKSTSDCLMYLGQANGTAIFYDVDSQRSIRIPATAVVILSSPLASPCRP